MSPQVRSWLANCEAVAKLCEPYPGEDSWQEAYWRTLTANTSQAVQKPQPELGDNFRYLQNVIDWDDDADKEMEVWKCNEENLEKGHKFWIALTGGSLGRHLFALKRRYMGLAPFVAEVGDLIYILYGAQAPFLLRPH